ncbi:hypothetical protein GQ600_430 [Phytophthora cactorum]|nr:hypothetical protein GQ600_430 [Phytophthora cactorum]
MHLLSLRESTERISFAEAVYLLKVVGSRFCMDCVVLSSCNAQAVYYTRIPPQKKCAGKTVRNNAEAKKTRSYKFCILNEAIHEEILSFLSNQTRTKMQMITGDRYEQGEPLLARYCCECENDNPPVWRSFCR